MSELYLALAGIRIRVSSDAPVTVRMLEGYLEEPGPVEHQFEVRLVSALTEPAGELVYHGAYRQICRDGERLMSWQGEQNRPYLCAIRQGEDGILEFLSEKMPQGITGKQILNAIDLPHLLTIHDGFLLHAAFIEHEGGAILFTAPSETGKSTQAKRWCDHAGAELINGDRAAVRLVGDTVLACGTPFAGSSDVRKNRTLPLKAIVYLTQAPENAVSRLRGVRAFRRVWEGCTVNTWDRDDMEKATQTVSGVISRIPVYHLACTPDIRAVEALKHTMEVEA